MLKASGLSFAALMALAAPAPAQESGRGFLFGRPDWNVSVSGGFSHPNAGSDIFSDITNGLTLRRSDFNGAAIGADLAYSIRSDLDLAFGVSYAGTSTRSEFRRWQDNNNQPIEQTTNFARVPLTASLKWYLMPRGRSVGRFAWIPATYAPYIGAGAGVMWYNFEQTGDFVDTNSTAKTVFNNDFVSSSWTPTAHVLAGIDYSLSPRWALRAEGRYSWARTDLSQDFSGYQSIDLSGFTTTVGLFVRF
jgi:opacity protein-like surface antigen